MNAVRVKICGITRKEDLNAAVVAGADAVGFVVDAPSSPRKISPDKAGALIKQVPPFVKSVMVTVPANLRELTEICEELNPDAVQIHGENLPDINAFKPKRSKTLLIRAVKANSPQVVGNAVRAAKVFDAVILDSFTDGKYGGTGVIHDWNVSRIVRQVIYPKSLILAGGLNPENVAEAVQTVEPYAVDVASGVEQRPGIKDHQKMVEFVERAKGCKT
jgi:phosphoribosylanthranilate isomerase